MVESLPSFRLIITSSLNPILALDTLIVNIIITEWFIIIDWLFILSEM